MTTTTIAEDPRICIVRNNHHIRSQCFYCGDGMRLQECQVVHQKTDSPVCHVCGWQCEPELMCLLQDIEFAGSVRNRLPGAKMPLAISEEIERRLCNAQGGEINAARGNSGNGDDLDPIPF